MITFGRMEEEKLKAKSKWQCLADIPDFPFQSFSDLRESLKGASPSYSLHFDPEAARQFIPLIGTYSTRGLYILLSSVWVLTIIICLMAGPILRQSLIMLGAFLALLGHVLGNPANPLRRTMTYIAIVAFLFLLNLVATGKTIGVWLLGSFTVSFWGNRALYALTRIVLYKALIISPLPA